MTEHNHTQKSSRSDAHDGHGGRDWRDGHDGTGNARLIGAFASGWAAAHPPLSGDKQRRPRAHFPLIGRPREAKREQHEQAEQAEGVNRRATAYEHASGHVQVHGDRPAR